MSKRCKLQKEFYKEIGNYKGDGNFSDRYVKWLEDKILAQGQTLTLDNVSISLFCRCPQAKGRDNDENGTPYCIECQNPIDERQIL